MKSDSEESAAFELPQNTSRSMAQKRRASSLVNIRISWFHATRLIYVYSFIVEAVAYILD